MTLYRKDSLMQVTETNCSTVDTSEVRSVIPIDALVELLKNGDEAQRCYSARALHSRILVADNSAIVETVLNDNLYHEDPDVVVDSAMALARLSIGDVSRLTEVTKFHPEADARLAALEALDNMMFIPEVEQLCIELAKGRRAEDNWGGDSDWDDWWDIQLKAVNSLSTHHQKCKNTNPDVVAVFKEILESDPEPELESKLYQGIAHYDVNWIIERLIIAEPASKRKLVKSLFFSADNMAKVFLFKQLDSPDAVIRKLAIEGLTKKAASEYFWDIVRCLQDEVFSVQKAATLALKAFSLASDIDQERLLNYIERSDSAARPLLFELLGNSGDLNSDKTDKALELLASSTPSSLLAITTLLLNSSLTFDQKQNLLELYKRAMSSSASDTATLSALIRQSSKIEGYDSALLSLLQDYIGRVDEQTLEYYYNATIRQSSYDALARSKYPACKQLIKNALFGVDAYSDSIAIDLIEPELTDTTKKDADHEVPVEALDESASENELASLLDQYEEKIDTPLSVVNTPSSTLGAIQQANIESELTPDKNEPEQQQRIIDMVEGLDPELGDYAQLVKDNFDTADNLDLNRRKIAKLPMFSNKLIAIKSLGQADSDDAAQWLIESILGAQPNELREVFLSLKRLKIARPNNKIVENGLGAAGNIVYHGDDLTKQAAISLLSVMPASKAIPLLIYSLTDKNDHVRLCSLVALESHMKQVKLNQRDMVSMAINQCLLDKSAGVKKQALKLAALNRGKVDVALTDLVEVAVDDEECHKVAESVFSSDEYRVEVLDLLSNQLSELCDHRQPNAIKLIGLLMA